MPSQWQPSNPDSSLPNEHTLYLGASGSGKSQVLLQSKAIPARGARVILFDHAPDHPGDHYRDPANFVRAVKAGIERHLKTGRGFRIAYAGPREVEDYEWFCSVVWRCLDGRYITHVIVEELSAVCSGSGKASPAAARLLNEGRKYGLRFHGTSQKPQEISKTYYDQCDYKVIGRQKTDAQRRLMHRETGVPVERIHALKPLQFYVDDGSADDAKLITLTFKKPTGIRWGD